MAMVTVVLLVLVRFWASVTVSVAVKTPLSL